MNKQSALEQIKQAAFEDELEKIALEPRTIMSAVEGSWRKTIPSAQFIEDAGYVGGKGKLMQEFQNHPLRHPFQSKYKIGNKVLDDCGCSFTVMEVIESENGIYYRLQYNEPIFLPESKVIKQQLLNH